MNKQHKKQLKPLILLLWAVAHGAYAQQPVMNLTECIGYAYENSPDLKVAQLKVSDAEWQIKESKAYGYPQLTGSLGYQYFIKVPALPASALGFGTSDERIAFQLRNNINGDVGVNQLLFSNDYLLGLRAAKLYRELAEEELATSKRTVRNQVIDAYLPALIIAESVKILDKNIGNLQTLMRETEATQKAGFSEQLDVDRLQLSISTLNSQRSNLLRQRETVLNALKFTMGYPVNDPLDVSDSVERLLNEYGVGDTTQQLNMVNRPEYRQVLKARELQTLDIERYTRPWMPVVSGYVNAQGSFQGNNELFWVPSSVAGVSANVNLWDGGISKAKRERSKVALAQVEQQQVQLENALNLEVENARKYYISAIADVKNREENLRLAERVYNTTQTKYKAGVGSSFELVSTEQQLFEAQRNLLDAQYQLLSAWTDFKQALDTE
ncbi:MAG: TolC family protein [Saprospiraceae bacterium]